MAHILGSLLKQRPNTFDNPWRLVVYSDEITPGNQVAHKNPRKTWAIYYSFLEFGSLLGSEEFWFTGTLVSSDTVRHIDGGWSSVIREFARMFWSPDGQDMERGGISIALCSESFSSSVRVHLRKDGHDAGGRGSPQCYVALEGRLRFEMLRDLPKRVRCEIHTAQRPY